jgi:hypothetical protein
MARASGAKGGINGPAPQLRMLELFGTKIAVLWRTLACSLYVLYIVLAL